MYFVHCKSLNLGGHSPYLRLFPSKILHLSMRETAQSCVLSLRQVSLWLVSRIVCLGYHNKIPKTGQLKQQNLFTPSSGGWKSEIEVPMWLVSSGALLLGLQMATISVCFQWPFFWFLFFFISGCQSYGIRAGAAFWQPGLKSVWDQSAGAGQQGSFSLTFLEKWAPPPASAAWAPSSWGIGRSCCGAGSGNQSKVGQAEGWEGRWQESSQVASPGLPPQQHGIGNGLTAPKIQQLLHRGPGSAF